MSVACSNNASSNHGPAESAGAGGTTADAAVVADATTPTDAGSSFICGSPGADWRRCAANPIVLGWQSTAFSPGKYVWTRADPTLLYDSDASLWKAWWSSAVAASCLDMVDEANREIDTMYAESTDGLHWTVQDQPALRSHSGPGAWDDTTVETPSVAIVPNAPPDKRFVLLYAGGNSALMTVAGQIGWQIGLAFSSDGKSFTRLPAKQSPYAAATTPFATIDGLVLLARDVFPGFPGVVSGIVADPSVLWDGAEWHLWFSSLGVDAGGGPVLNGSRIAYGISHATSSDLIHWTPQADNPVIMGGGQPTVVRDDASGRLDMWYGADTDQDKVGIPSALFPTRGFFHAQSSDGLAWSTQASRDFDWDPTLGYESLGLINGAAVVRTGAELRLYYGAWGTANVPSGSCAFVNGDAGVVPVPGVFTLNVATKVP